MYNKSLNTQALLAFKWYKRLIKIFIKISFIPTIIIVISTLFSQLFVLLSSVMPLKVMMLLGSPAIPKFFPISWQGIERNTLVVYLAIASIGCFILYLISEKIIDVYGKKGANKILEKNNKITLLENQNIYAQNSYIKLSKSLSDTVFFILSIIGLGVVYPLLSLVISLFIVVTYIIFSQMYNSEKLSKYTNENLNNSLNLVKGIGFFVVFTFILTSFIVDFYPPQIIIIILSVLLTRQMLSKLNDAIKNMVYLYKNKVKVSSLFLFSHAETTISDDKHNLFWNLIEHNTRDKWCKQLLDNILSSDITIVSINWYQVNIKNIAFLKVTVLDKNTNETKLYLLKLFNKNILSRATHEAIFLSENDKSYNLQFLGTSLVKQFRCNIFEFDNITAITQKDFNTAHITIRISMMSVEPSKTLIDRHNRSHLCLHKRLNKQIFDKLNLVFNADNIELITEFENNFDNIIAKIEKLPLQLTNGTITKYSLIKNKDKLSLLHWGNWRVDAIGVEFPININHIDRLKKDFKNLQEKRIELASVKIDDVILSSLMAHFEKLYNSENFTGIIELIPRILRCLENE